MVLRWFAAVVVGLVLAPAPPLLVTDVDGRSWTLLAPPAGKPELLFFIGTECPISNRYAPEIARICREYGARGVQCFLVYPDASTRPAGAKTHRQAFGLAAIPAIIDTRYAVVDAAGARVTPEAVIFTSRGRAYRGRIDDQYLDVTRSRPAPAHHDLRLALDAILAGRPAPGPQVPAVGCFIERR